MQALSQESAALREGRASLEETRKALDAAAGAVSQRSAELEKNVQALSQKSAALREGRASLEENGKQPAMPGLMTEQGHNASENNDNAVPAEHEPVQEQR